MVDLVLSIERLSLEHMLLERLCSRLCLVRCWRFINQESLLEDCVSSPAVLSLFGFDGQRLDGRLLVEFCATLMADDSPKESIFINVIIEMSLSWSWIDYELCDVVAFRSIILVEIKMNICHTSCAIYDISNYRTLMRLWFYPSRTHDAKTYITYI